MLRNTPRNSAPLSGRHFNTPGLSLLGYSSSNALATFLDDRPFNGMTVGQSVLSSLQTSRWVYPIDECIGPTVSQCTRSPNVVALLTFRSSAFTVFAGARAIFAFAHASQFEGSLGKCVKHIGLATEAATYPHLPVVLEFHKDLSTLRA